MIGELDISLVEYGQDGYIALIWTTVIPLYENDVALLFTYHFVQVLC